MKVITQKDCDIKNQRLYNKIVCFDYPTKPNFIDMSGMIVDYLHVNKYLGRTHAKDAVFQCTCVCGNIVFRTGESLRSKNIHSCGCKHDKTIENNKSKIIHGDSKQGQMTHLYMIWCSMRYRCYNPNNQKYSEYGGRGITVDDTWIDKENGYINFKNWALNNGYKEGLSIDRKNPNGNYCPDNCRWVTPEIQNINKRNTPYIIIGKYALPISIWGKVYNIHPKTITRRIAQGWQPFEAVMTPSNKPRGEYIGYLYVPEEYEIYNKYNEFLESNKIIEYNQGDINIRYIFAHDGNYFY